MEPIGIGSAKYGRVYGSQFARGGRRSRIEIHLQSVELEDRSPGFVIAGVGLQDRYMAIEQRRPARQTIA